MLSKQNEGLNPLIGTALPLLVTLQPDIRNISPFSTKIVLSHTIFLVEIVSKLVNVSAPPSMKSPHIVIFCN